MSLPCREREKKKRNASSWDTTVPASFIDKTLNTLPVSGGEGEGEGVNWGN